MSDSDDYHDTASRMCHLVWYVFRVILEECTASILSVAVYAMQENINAGGKHFSSYLILVCFLFGSIFSPKERACLILKNVC
jgi:hypothetical protein